MKVERERVELPTASVRDQADEAVKKELHTQKELLHKITII